jgi:hypothetical protein
MIRRSLLAATALVLLGGGGAQALAVGIDDAGDRGRHTLCVMGGNSGSATRDGVCVWVPTR